MSHVEAILESKTRELQQIALSQWRGHERLALTEVARAADQAAFSVTFVPLEQLDWEREWHILFGVAPALAAFLPLVRAQPGTGMPWMPSNEELAGWTDDLLHDLGKLASLQRLAELERYGLARCEVEDDRKITMHVRSDDAESGDIDAARWLREETKRRIAALVGDHIGQKRIIELLDSTSDIRSGWGIRYDGHEDLIALYGDRALIEVAACSEAEALADDAVIGGRSFAEWRGACTFALGRVFNHLAYATRLKARHPELMLRNLMTLAALKKDIAEVWVELGEQQGRVGETISHLMLDASTIGAWQKHHEIPAPFYIDAGGDWLLLPMFGGLLNPVCGLTRTLRDRHARQWDSLVGLRERHFRLDLQNLFPRPRYVVPDSGFVLRRDDGSHLTDVDAAILDASDGTLALVQLKWPDIFGRSTRERESRRLNLLKANDWIERVSSWISGRTTGEVCKSLGIERSQSSQQPILIVLSRYMNHYIQSELDARAAWLSWPQLLRFSNQSDNRGSTFRDLVKAAALGDPLQLSRRPSSLTYEFRGLSVQVLVG